MPALSSKASILIQNHLRCLLLLESCASMHHLFQIHAQTLRSHFFQDPFAASKIVDFCCSGFHIGNLHYARKVFDQIPHPNTFTWNTIIRGYADSPFPKLSVHLFRQMLASAAAPNIFTFPSVIKACAHLAALREGEQVHGYLVKSVGDSDVFSANGLIYMYASCGEIDPARMLFVSFGQRDLVSWNAMLSGYANRGMLDAAGKIFDEMPERGIVSWNAMLTAYAKCGRIDAARELFDLMPHRNIESWNALISGYAKCGCLEMSRKLFDEMPTRNVVSWSTIIAACAQGDHPGEALALFEEMKFAGMKPNCATIVSVLSACAQLGALGHGKCIHVYLEGSKMKMNSVVGTALLDMYAKCGCIDDAFRIFEGLDEKDVFTWTAMINGLAVNGLCEKALELFNEMEVAGLRPNKVTFLGVLSACSHRGLVLKCKQYFDMMVNSNGIEPQIEHYGCLVDSLCRAGRLEESISLLQSMDIKPNSVLWGALLGACSIHGRAKVAEYAVQHLVDLSPNDGTAYAVLSNIYAMAGRWDDAKKLRIFMNYRGLQKIPGISSIELNGSFVNCMVGDKSTS